MSSNKNNSNKKQPQQQKKKEFDIFKLAIPFTIVSVFAFTGIAVWLQFAISMELSSTLITCFFAFCTGELWMLSSIKKVQIYTDVDNDGIPDHIDDEIDEKYYSYQQGVEDALAKVREELAKNDEKGDDIF